MQNPAVSVIINTLDRAAALDRTLVSLGLLRYDNFEIVVVQGPCSDDTPAVLARHAAVIRIGHCPQANLSMSRNIGIAMAAGEIVAFLDDDAVPEPDWLDRLVERLQSSETAAVGGFIRDRSGVMFQYRTIVADRFGNAEESADPSPPVPPGRFISPTGTNIAIRRDALVSVGGFDEYYAYFLEETDLNLRLADAGWTLVMAPEAEVHHGFLENQIRDAGRAPRSTYMIARSKAYFCHANAADRHPAAEIARQLAKFRRQQQKKLIRALFMRRIGLVQVVRLMEEIRRGIADGTRNARTQPSRKLLTAMEGQPLAAFRRYGSALPAELRFRICFSSYEYETGLRVLRAAQAFALAGHEVTVICPGDEDAPAVTFADGFWLHRLPRDLARADSAETWNAAVTAEIRRTRARRAYQALIVAHPDDVTSPLRELDLPVLVLGAAGPGGGQAADGRGTAADLEYLTAKLRLAREGAKPS